MTRRWLLGVGGLALVGVVVWRAWFVGGNDDSARLRALEARLAQLESRRAPGTGQRFVREVAPLTAPVPPPITRLADPEDQPAGKKTPPAAPVNEAEIEAEYFGDLEVRLGTELRDPIWAVSTEEKLRSSGLDLRPKLSVENARCGQTMCRVETTIPGARDEAAVLEKFLLATATLLPEAVIRDGDAPGRHIVYFARPGSGFPPMVAPEGRP